MFKFTKKLLFSTLVVYLCVMSFSSSASIKMYYQNNLIQTDTNPVIVNGRTIVPIAVIAENMNLKTKWDGSLKKVTIYNENLKPISLEMIINDKEVYIERNDSLTTKIIDSPPQIINGRTMVPLRLVSEVFGSEINYLSKDKIILIDSQIDKITSLKTSNKTSNNYLVSKNSYEKLIVDNLKNVPRLHYILPEKNNIQIYENTVDSYSMMDLRIKSINEKNPGHYKSFSVFDKTRKTAINSTLLFYINTDNNSLYIDEGNAGIYSMPHYKNILFPNLFQFDDMYDMQEVIAKTMRSVLINTNKIELDDELSIETISTSNNKIKVSALKEDGIGSHNIGVYIIDFNNKKVFDSNNKVVFYDSYSYTQKHINDKNADSETLSMLKKLKLIDNNTKYYITDISQVVVRSKDGYSLAIRQDNPNNDGITNLVGIFFISNDGTTIYKYDIISDSWNTLYGFYK